VFRYDFKRKRVPIFEYVLEVSDRKIALIEPDVVVCDNGLKAFTVPFIVKIKFLLFLNVMGQNFLKNLK
jgi:hypothetical protein